MSLASPYKGLAAFDDSDLDALLFFGRERDTQIVVANLIASRLTVLYGPSGVGKSSLLLASVARTLRELPEGALVVVFSSWNDEPERLLADAVADGAGVERGPLAEVAEKAQADRDVYVILDQAEEYFMYHGSDGTFRTALAALLDPLLRVNVLLSLREDALAALDGLKSVIPSLFGNVLRLDRLDRDAGRVAILGPLARWEELEGEAVTIEDELVAAVLDGVGAGRIELGHGGQGAPDANGRTRGIEAPYLQLVMQRLWDVERARGSTALRAATLTELGGAGQVVADHLERAIEALTPRQRDVAARLFEHLVTPSGTKIAHEPGDLAQFARRGEDEVRDVLTVLADHRILRRDEVGRWEIFHDVLAAAVLGWKSRYEAERAVAQARDDARRRNRRLDVLAMAAVVGLAVAGLLAAWAFVERDRARERAVEARAHELEARAVTVMPSDTSMAVALAADAARAAPSASAEDVLREALLVDRLLYVISTGAPVVDVAPGAGSRFFVATTGGLARRYAARESRRPTADLETRYGSPVTTVGEDAAGMLSASRGGNARLTRDSAGVSGRGQTLRQGEPVVAFGPVACELASGCLLTAAGRTLVVWSRRDGGRLRAVELRNGIAEVVPWAGAVVALRTRRGTILLVDLRRGRIARELRTDERVDSIAADPAGNLVAAGLADGTVLVWDTTTDRLETRYEPHLKAVLALDVANGMLLSGAADGSAAVRNLRTGRTISLPGGHANIVRAVDLSDDGRFAVTAGADQSAKVWATSDGRLVSLLAGHGDVVTDATFTDGARRVVTGGLDGTVRVWESGAADDLVVVDHAPLAPSVRAARARDGATAVAVDDVIRLRTQAGERLTLRGHRDEVNAVAFSADGNLLVSASRDHDARIWDARTGEPIQQLEGHFGSVADARFSPDGRWVVTAGPISAGLWNVRTGELVSYLRGFSSRPVAVAFEPDSRTILAEERNGTVRRFACDVCGTIDDLRALAERRLARASRTTASSD